MQQACPRALLTSLLAKNAASRYSTKSKRVNKFFLISDPIYTSNYQNRKTAISSTDISCLIIHSFVTLTYFKSKKHFSTEITFTDSSHWYIEIIEEIRIIPVAMLNICNAHKELYPNTCQYWLMKIYTNTPHLHCRLVSVCYKKHLLSSLLLIYIILKPHYW